MEFLNNGAETSACRFKKLKAGSDGLGLFGLVSLVDWLVPYFPRETSAKSCEEIEHYVPLNDRSKLLNVHHVVKNVADTRSHCYFFLESFVAFRVDSKFSRYGR